MEIPLKVLQKYFPLSAQELDFTYLAVKEVIGEVFSPVDTISGVLTALVIGEEE